MKLSIKVLAVMALFFTFSFAANAQRGGGRSVDPEQMAEQQTTRMIEQLSLDEAQAAKVQAINLTYAEKIQAVRQDNRGNREAMKETLTAIQADKTAELKGILTAEQIESYEALEAKGRKRGRGQRGQDRDSQ